MSDTESPDDSSSAESPSTDTSAESPPSRRNMLVESATALISFLLIVVPSALAGIFYLHPILGRKKADGTAGGTDLGSHIRLEVTRDVIPDDGTPVAVTVKTTLDDAWNRFRNVPVGSVWLRKLEGGEITAFNSICPHLGCSVNYRRGQGDFFCPCHTSAFDLDGKKTNEVPPRNMDALEIVTATDGKADPGGQELWLQFRNFRKATAEKIPI